jgi:hypothetical protein
MDLLDDSVRYPHVVLICGGVTPIMSLAKHLVYAHHKLGQAAQETFYMGCSQLGYCRRFTDPPRRRCVTPDPAAETPFRRCLDRNDAADESVNSSSKSTPKDTSTKYFGDEVRTEMDDEEAPTDSTTLSAEEEVASSDITTKQEQAFQGDIYLTQVNHHHHRSGTRGF